MIDPRGAAKTCIAGQASNNSGEWKVSVSTPTA